MWVVRAHTGQATTPGASARQARPAADRQLSRRRSNGGIGRASSLDVQPSPLAETPYLVAQQKRLSGMFGPAVVQRYTLINPANYAAAAGSKFSKQDVVAGGGTSGFTRTTVEQTGGGVVSSTERGTGAGVWSAPSAPAAAALPTIKYGTDGTDAIALESTTAEPKVFYATPGVIAASNTKLASLEAEARLVDAGGSMDAPQDVTNLGGATLNLHMVKPGATPVGHPPQVLEKFGQISECNSFVKYILGNLTERVAVFGAGAGHEALVEEEKEPNQAIATFAGTNVGNAQALAAHLESTGTSAGKHDTPLPATYTGMGTKAARDTALGINAGARAGVGEGYVISQNSPMPDSVTVTAWLAAFDKKVAGAAMTSAERDMFKHKWGYHYAGVVAAVGGDAITLENYNRGTQKHWELDKLYNDRIANVLGLRTYLNVLAARGEEIPSVPMLRNQWFADLRAELLKLGDLTTVSETATRDALGVVADAVKGLEVGAPALWHFKMYGDQAGQSFHEQWEGSLENPMTLRIRQIGRSGALRRSLPGGGRRPRGRESQLGDRHHPGTLRRDPAPCAAARGHAEGDSRQVERGEERGAQRVRNRDARLGRRCRADHGQECRQDSADDNEPGLARSVRSPTGRIDSALGGGGLGSAEQEQAGARHAARGSRGPATQDNPRGRVAVRVGAGAGQQGLTRGPDPRTFSTRTPPRLSVGPTRRPSLSPV